MIILNNYIMLGTPTNTAVSQV